MIRFHIIVPSASSSSDNPSLQDFKPNLRTFHLPLRTFCPQSNYLWSDYPNKITRREETAKLFITQPSTTSYHFISLRSRYSYQHLVSRHSQYMPFPYVRNHVSHPHKTTDKIVVLCILIFTGTCQFAREDITKFITYLSQDLNPLSSD
jgi:hypothetical protein